MKVQFFVFFRKDERKRINVRAFSTLRIGQSCRTRSTFEETVFQQQSVFRLFDVFCVLGTFWEGAFECFLRNFNGFVIIWLGTETKNDETGSIKISVQSDLSKLH